jgi:hypothetical protein
MLSEKNEPKAPPMPSLSMKCVWHAWVEKIPYQASRYNVGDEILCTWQSGVETYAATVKRLNPKAKIADEQRRGTTTITVELFKVLQQGLAYVCI